MKLPDPVGAKAPSFSSDAKSSSYTRAEGNGFGLLCLAQGYPAPAFRLVLRNYTEKIIADPVGSKAPKFTLDTHTLSFTRHSSQGFALLCQAQGFPVPSFRWGN
jgi:hypothetical protein